MEFFYTHVAYFSHSECREQVTFALSNTLLLCCTMSPWRACLATCLDWISDNSLPDDMKLDTNTVLAVKNGIELYCNKCHVLFYYLVYESNWQYSY